MFHICQDDGRHDAFLCPNQTLFNQKYFGIVYYWFFVANLFFKNVLILKQFATGGLTLTALNPVHIIS